MTVDIHDTDRLLERARNLLITCGPCERGVMTERCNHAHGDPRPVITDLVAEIERLQRAQFSETRPTECGCPATVRRVRVEQHTRECGTRQSAERLNRYIDEECGDDN